MNHITISKTIIYEDSSLIVCHKPAGTAVQTKKAGEQDMVSLLKNYLAEALGKPPYLGIIHRLDQPVEGLLLFAKTPFAAKELSSSLSKGFITKKYLAVTAGMPKDNFCCLTDYLLKDAKTNTSKIVSADTKGARQAVLSYQVKENFAEKCLLEINLKTGRHHQIRVQLAHIGAPLLGDTKYGGPPSKAFTSSIALCAYDLTFPHPKTGKTLHFQVKPKNPAFLPFYE